MRLNRRLKIQLALFTTVALIAGAIMIFGYMRVPTMLGIGRYTVTVELPRAAGLYASGNVTYRGTEVGRVEAVRLTDTGVAAELSLRSDVAIPSDLDAEVHSTSAIGEQYVALLPRRGDTPPLKNGDVIPIGRTSVPPDINALLDDVNRALQAIPRDNVKTMVDESYEAVGGLGPELSRLVRSTTQLSTDARANLDSLVALIDKSRPVLDSQADTAEEIQAWAAHLADLTGQMKSSDAALGSLLEQGAESADEARQLVDRLSPTLPILLANYVSIGELALTYLPGIEQILTLVPMTVSIMQAVVTANRNTKYRGVYLDFNLNLNVPPICATGYLPPSQRRPPALEDTPEPPPGDMYCRIPQDSWNAVRGARNIPCLSRPGKRAPTAKMCKSDEEYVPLNDGWNWKGDPNATTTGQSVPQFGPEPPPPAEAAVPPIATAYYDPATGQYVGPDGQLYTQAELAPSTEGKTWQSILIPPGS